IPDPGLVRSLAALIRQKDPHVVHAHSWILHSLLPLLPTSRARLVVTMHDYGMVCAKTTLVHKGTVCTGPDFAKCVACASGQYGVGRATALTTGLTVMRRWHRRVDRYIAVSNPVAEACMSLTANGRPPI